MMNDVFRKVYLTMKSRVFTTVILFILFCMVYPVVRISSCEGLLMSVVYTLLLGYTIVLIVRRVRLDRPAVAEACV